MTIQEVLMQTETSGTSKKMFSREFWRDHESGKFDKADVFCETFKGRINHVHEYKAYESIAFLCGHLRATDWLFVDDSEVLK